CCCMRSRSSCCRWPARPPSPESRDFELQALEAICDAKLAQDRPLEAERVARRLIAADSLRESGYRCLMRALAASGNAAQAAAVMAECRTALGLVAARPSAETERVFREVVTAR